MFIYLCYFLFSLFYFFVKQHVHSGLINSDHTRVLNFENTHQVAILLQQHVAVFAAKSAQRRENILVREHILCIQEGGAG